MREVAAHALRHESCHTCNAATCDVVGMEHDLKLKLKQTRFFSFSFGFSFSRGSAHEGEAEAEADAKKSDPNDPLDSR